MLFLFLSVLALLPLKTQAMLCHDEILFYDGSPSKYVYELPLKPFDDFYNQARIKHDKPRLPAGVVTHNLNLAYNIFGIFNGNTDDTVIEAGYYAEDGLIYSVKVNCGEKTWKSYTPKLDDPQTPELYQEGELEKECNDGEEFDLIFKVKQAHQFTWMFNAEPLQTGTQVTKRTFLKGQTREIKNRTRTLNVPSPDPSPKGGAARAVELVIETSGAAVLTRLAAGRCMAWPAGKTCEDTKKWLEVRSKARGEGYLGPLGLHNVHFTVTCVGEVPTLYYPQQIFHPDAYSFPHSTWVCCVDMKSGQLFTENKDDDCMELVDWKTQNEPFFCAYAWDDSLVAEEIARLEQLG